ncbi:MAG: hypothetical protein E7010_06095 [Alphaproteobacteria bacterium]|nr:hypothetical protein [Alphaproteobacteria bacterium]
MDNIINSALNVLPTVNISDKTVLLNVAQLPSGIKIGDTILLEMLMNSSQTTDNSQTDVVLNILSDKQKIPLQPKGELPQKLDTLLPRQYMAKVVSENTLQLILSDKRPQITDNQNISQETIIIKETNVSLPQAKLQPLSGRQVLGQVMQELKLPQPIQNQINQLLPPTLISLRIENPVVVKTEYPILEPLKIAVQNLSSAVVANDTPQIIQTRDNVMQALHNLVTQKFIAVTASATSNKVLTDIPQLKSPLGIIQLETSLKLPPEIKLEVMVTDVHTEKQMPQVELPLQTLEKIFSQPELSLIFPKADATSLQNLLQNRDEAVTNLLKVFEPLHDMPQTTLPILQKLPTLNKSLLSNLYAFYKAARNQDAEIWLGREIVTDLQSTGQKGQAVLQNLQEMVSISTRETPLWRLIEIPLFDGSQVIPFKLAVKKDMDKEQQEYQPDEKAVRFVIETEFSKLGAFQLDGFSVVKKRKLDLIVRTSKPQNDDFCTHIINLFKTSLYNVGYIGNITVNQKEAFIKTEADGVVNLPEGVFI